MLKPTKLLLAPDKRKFLLPQGTVIGFEGLRF